MMWQTCPFYLSAASLASLASQLSYARQWCKTVRPLVAKCSSNYPDADIEIFKGQKDLETASPPQAKPTQLPAITKQNVIRLPSGIVPDPIGGERGPGCVGGDEVFGFECAASAFGLRSTVVCKESVNGSKLSALARRVQSGTSCWAASDDVQGATHAR